MTGHSDTGPNAITVIAPATPAITTASATAERSTQRRPTSFLISIVQRQFCTSG